MENASKALLLIAEVLVGIMIISIGVYLFNEFASYSAQTTAQIEDRQIAQFNQQFLNYTGSVTTTDSDGNVYHGARPCTIHDIVGLANLAKQTNINNGFEEGYTERHDSNSTDNSAYIQIKFKSSRTGTTINNLEAYTSSEITELIKANDIDDSTGDILYFQCSDYYIGTNVKTINYMYFTDL